MTDMPPGDARLAPAPAFGTLRNWCAWAVILACTAFIMWDVASPEGPPDTTKPQAVADPGPQLNIFVRLVNGMHALSGMDPNARQSALSALTGNDLERMVQTSGPGAALTGATILARQGKTADAMAMVEHLQQKIESGEVVADDGFTTLAAQVHDAVRAVDAPRADALSDEAKHNLPAQLGLAGDMLVAMATGDEALSGALQRQGFLMVVTFAVALMLAALGAIAGLVLLCIFTVQAVTGRVRGPGASAGTRAPVYAEMFAVWLLVFLAMARLPRAFLSAPGEGGVPPVSTEWMLAISIAGMALALIIALAYARVRGVPWAVMREDLALARPSFMDVVWGAMGYMMALPLLIVGIICAAILMSMQQGSGAQPSHPVQEWLQDGSGLTVALTFVVASIAAPITEEIMFRGAMYRNLRDSFGAWGAVLPAAVAMLVSSVIFAAIHPQGVVFIPVLASLAVAFCILREWRGSIYPAIWAHAMSNGIILTLNVVLLS